AKEVVHVLVATAPWEADLASGVQAPEFATELVAVLLAEAAEVLLPVARELSPGADVLLGDLYLPTALRCHLREQCEGGGTARHAVQDDVVPAPHVLDDRGEGPGGAGLVEDKVGVIADVS